MENDFLSPEEEIEEMYYKIRDPETGMHISARKGHIGIALMPSFIVNNSMKFCFQGHDLVAFLMSLGKHKFIAEQIGQSLLDKLIIHRISDADGNKCDDGVFVNNTSLYRFQEDVDTSLLNNKRIFSGYVRSSQEIISDLFNQMQTICEKYIFNLKSKEFPQTTPTLESTTEDRTIDYLTIQKSTEYKTFVNTSIELQQIQPGIILKSGEREFLAFFVNVYNVLLFHANIERIKPKNMKQLFLRPKIPIRFGYNFGGQKYTLSDIENGVLRGNKKPFIVFSKHDIRKDHVLSLFHPKVHFLLGTTASDTYGNPILPKLYHANDVFDAMESATEFFCSSDAVKVFASKKTILLHWIFDTYKFDFGKDKTEMIQWISNYLIDEEKKMNLLQLIEDPQTKIKHKLPKL